jgi:antitoxin (DNA-binding transcriptional repressor) of toxin-antitoxin stability system
MKRASATDLRDNFATVSKWIQAGEAVTITKCGRAFATLSPGQPSLVKPAPDFL